MTAPLGLGMVGCGGFGAFTLAVYASMRDIRVVAVTDAGWIANFALTEEGVPGVAIKGQDNAEIFDRLAQWAAHAGSNR